MLTCIRLTGTNPFASKDYRKALRLSRACHVWFEHPVLKLCSAQTLPLLMMLLAKEPTERPSAAEALNQPYFKETMNKRIRYERQLLKYS